MTGDYEPLDFELEDPLPIAHQINNKKKKLIGLDDLLVDFEKEQKRLDKKKAIERKIKKVRDAEDVEDDVTEAQLSKCVDECEKEINQINGDEEVPFWGIQVFGDQGNLLRQEFSEPKNSVLLQCLMKQEISSLVEHNIDKGDSILEGLLTGGWLLHLVFTRGFLEKSLATWTSNLMLYSSKIQLMEAACEFWCSILSLKSKGEWSGVRIDWLPRYSDLKEALKEYGFLLDSCSKALSVVDTDPTKAGPPQNIRSWIKYASLCCQRRNDVGTLAVKEAEELFYILICLLLDRQLLGLSKILYDSMLSVINCFSDEEWPESCKEVAKSLAHRLPSDINCLRVMESIKGANGRSKQLRSSVAFEVLVTCLDEKECDGEDILRLLTSINVKDKNCDLFRVYIYLNLVENWLSFDTTIENKEGLQLLWGTLLRNCSCGLTITDLRSYASIVRSKASYLLQGSRSK